MDNCEPWPIWGKGYSLWGRDSAQQPWVQVVPLWPHVVFTRAKRPVGHTAPARLPGSLASATSFASRRSFRARLRSGLFHDGVSSPALAGTMLNLQKSRKNRTRALWQLRLALANVFAVCRLSVQVSFPFLLKVADIRTLYVQHVSPKGQGHPPT